MRRLPALGVLWTMAFLSGAVLVALNLGVVSVSAAPAGVQFVSADPLVLEEQSLNVHLYNGSPATQTLLLHAEGGQAALVSITGPPATQAATRAAFEVRLTMKRPAEAVSVPLVATSTDGSISRQSLQVKGTTAAAEPGAPSKLQLRATAAVASPLAHLPGIGRVFRNTVRVEPVAAKSFTASGSSYLSGDSGRLVLVSFDKGKVVVGPLKAAGTYEGPMKLAKGDTAVVMKVRDFWLWALGVLGVGVLAAIGFERYLTRVRPRRHLDWILGTLKVRVVDAHIASTQQLHHVQRGASFSLDRIYSPVDKDQPPQGYLGKRARQLEGSFAAAMADFERERFGPGSDAVKDLEARVSEYLDHLEVSVRAARLADSIVQDGEREAEQHPLLEQVAAVLTGQMIESRDGLDDRRTQVKNLLARLKDIQALAERIDGLATIAAAGGSARDLARQARILRSDLLVGADLSPGGDLKYFRDRANSLQRSIQEGADNEEAQQALRKLRRRSVAKLYPDVRPGRGLAPGDSPIHPQPQISRPDEDIRKKLRASDRSFAFAGALVVMASGMTALYFNDDTFGTTLDYLAILLWGATAQQGINLARRLLPGALTKLG